MGRVAVTYSRDRLDFEHGTPNPIRPPDAKWSASLVPISSIILQGIYHISWNGLLLLSRLDPD
jgi:hypothetical protein